MNVNILISKVRLYYILDYFANEADDENILFKVHLSIFRDCWPVRDKKMEQDFRKSCNSWLARLSKVCCYSCGFVICNLLCHIFVCILICVLICIFMQFKDYCNPVNALMQWLIRIIVNQKKQVNVYVKTHW